MDFSNPTTQQYIGAVIRTVLVVLLGGLIQKGLVTNDQVSELAGIVLATFVLGWSIWQKYKSTKDHHAALENAVNAAVATPEKAPAIIAAAKAGKF